MGYPTGYCQLAKEESGKVNLTHSAIVSAWKPVFLNGRYYIPIATVVANTQSAGYVEGIFRFAITSGVTLAAGDRVYLEENADAYRVQLAKPTSGNLLGTVMIGGVGNAGGTVEAYVAINCYDLGTGNFGTADITTEGQVFSRADETAITASGAVTLTVEQVLGGSLDIDCGSANRTVTTPTAALIVAGLKNPKADSAMTLYIKNTSDAAETITMAGGTGVTVTGTATAAQNATKIFRLVLTNVGTGTEAAVLKSIGTLVH